MPLQPIDNYLLPLPDPTEGIRKNLELGLNVQQSQQVAQINDLKIQEAQRQLADKRLADQRLASLRTDLLGLSQNFNPNAIPELMAKYPEFKEQIKAQSDALSDAEVRQLAPIHAAMIKNASGIVTDKIEELAKSYENSKQPLKAHSLQTLLQSYINDPGGTTAVLASKLATDMGPGKYAETFGKLVEQPADLLKKESDAAAAKVTADYAEQKAQTDIASTKATTVSALATAAKTTQETKDLKDLAPGNVDKQKLDIQKLKRDLSTLPEAVGKEVNSYVDAAESAQTAATKAGNLANEFDKIEGFFKSGLAAKAERAARNIWGNEGTRSAVRAQYEDLKNQITLDKLKGIRITENEIALVQRAYPEGTSDPKYIADFLRQLRDVAKERAESNIAKSQWVSANLALTPATKELTILGQKVKPGTGFNEFLENIKPKPAEAAAKQAPATTAEAPAAAAPAAPKTDLIERSRKFLAANPNSPIAAKIRAAAKAQGVTL
jgi:hypothetical protein